MRGLRKRGKPIVLLDGLFASAFALSDSLLVVPRLRSIDMASVSIDYPGGRSVPLLSAIDSWAAQVLRMFRESVSQADPRTEDVWGPDDLVGALLARDRIETAMPTPTDHDISELLPTLAVADELFRLFTAPDETKLIGEVCSADARVSWWWKRVPKSGPIREELLVWRQARQGR